MLVVRGIQNCEFSGPWGPNGWRPLLYRTTSLLVYPARLFPPWYGYLENYAFGNIRHGYESNDDGNESVIREFPQFIATVQVQFSVLQTISHAVTVP
jgi:hypothetical protein